MIKFNNIEEKKRLVHYAKEFGDANILNIIENGVRSEVEAILLARFYWKVIEETINKKELESILEKIYTSLHIHCGNNGYSDTWDNEIPN
ncbi:hypothetical protein [Marinibactrum halimedae]|uniref:Uncharacterized protein n=1 Tax=Marinibactrum halimedae TaxID=1444977 RepID=A0AA37WL15_9GAMM|nr:hypothetical protein [Marinibactrum halimedae]MCD9459123.1 hypothetical protein [Marinibactrum halimedae]GLS24725.1 hypothetical protein GCM10007877_04390 [Marinibactrum halimedae]